MAEYTLPDLDWDYAALEPHISGQINEIHHTKHHAAYVKGLNDAVAKLDEARANGDHSSIFLNEKNLAFRSIYDDEVTIRVLWRACRDPNDPTLRKNVFPGPKPMREVLTLDQIGVLAHADMRVERLLSPIRFIMDKEEMDGLLLRLREGGRESAPLDYLSSELLRELLMHSVSNPLPSPTPSGSPGAPPDSSESPGSENPNDEGGAPEESPPEMDSSEVPTPSAPDEPDLKKKLILG